MGLRGAVYTSSVSRNIIKQHRSIELALIIRLIRRADYRQERFAYSYCRHADDKQNNKFCNNNTTTTTTTKQHDNIATCRICTPPTQCLKLSHIKRFRRVNTQQIHLTSASNHSCDYLRRIITIISLIQPIGCDDESTE